MTPSGKWVRFQCSKSGDSTSFRSCKNVNKKETRKKERRKREKKKKRGIDEKKEKREKEKKKKRKKEKKKKRKKEDGKKNRNIFQPSLCYKSNAVTFLTAVECTVSQQIDFRIVLPKIIVGITLVLD